MSAKYANWPVQELGGYEIHPAPGWAETDARVLGQRVELDGGLPRVEEQGYYSNHTLERRVMWKGEAAQRPQRSWRIHSKCRNTRPPNVSRSRGKATTRIQTLDTCLIFDIPRNSRPLEGLIPTGQYSYFYRISDAPRQRDTSFAPHQR